MNANTYSCRRRSKNRPFSARHPATDTPAPNRKVSAAWIVTGSLLCRTTPQQRSGSAQSGQCAYTHPSSPGGNALARRSIYSARSKHTRKSNDRLVRCISRLLVTVRLTNSTYSLLLVLEFPQEKARDVRRRKRVLRLVDSQTCIKMRCWKCRLLLQRRTQAYFELQKRNRRIFVVRRRRYRSQCLQQQSKEMQRTSTPRSSW